MEISGEFARTVVECKKKRVMRCHFPLPSGLDISDL
jgi:hypothetical protein